jgi:hypothetical protein
MRAAGLSLSPMTLSVVQQVSVFYERFLLLRRRKKRVLLNFSLFISLIVENRILIRSPPLTLLQFVVNPVTLFSMVL